MAAGEELYSADQKALDHYDVGGVATQRRCCVQHPEIRAKRYELARVLARPPAGKLSRKQTVRALQLNARTIVQWIA